MWLDPARRNRHASSEHPPRYDKVLLVCPNSLCVQIACSDITRDATVAWQGDIHQTTADNRDLGILLTAAPP